MKKSIVLALALLTLTGCSETVGDREGGAGKKADQYHDTSHVTVYRNADDVPNVAFFCTDGYGWVSTLSGGSDGTSKSASLERFPDYDRVCAGEADSMPAPLPR